MRRSLQSGQKPCSGLEGCARPGELGLHEARLVKSKGNWTAPRQRLRLSITSNRGTQPVFRPRD